MRRWGTAVIGFVGVIVVLQPRFRAPGGAHLGAVSAVLGRAVSVLTFRALGTLESTRSLYGAGMLDAVVVWGVLMLPHLTVPDAWRSLKVLSYGLLSALAYLLLVRAVLYAPATNFGPTQYSQILWAVCSTGCCLEPLSIGSR